MLAKSLYRRLGGLGIQFADFAEILGDVRRGIHLAVEEDHQALALVLVRLVGHQSRSAAVGTRGRSSAAQVETVAEVVQQESLFAWDTEIPAGPTETWWRVDV